MAKAMVFICLLSLVLLIHNIDASNEFLVESTTCNALNEKSRLQFGDTITYVYEVEKSLVTRIRQEDYIICNTPSPVDVTKSSDYGYSMVKLNQIGPKYSISGIVENNKDKILIHVIAGQRLSPPARAAVRAPAQPQAQTIGQSEGFLYFSFFTFGFMSCIALLGLCIVLFVLSAVFIAGSIAFAVFNATTSTAVNNATNSSKVNNATNSSKVNNATTSSAVNNATTSSAVNNATNSSATNSSEVNNETTSSEVNNTTTSSTVNNATNSSAVNNATT